MNLMLNMKDINKILLISKDTLQMQNKKKCEKKHHIL